MSVVSANRAREQRAREIENAIASGRMEGLEPSAGAMVIFQSYVDGKLTLEQMGTAMDEYVDREYGPVRLPGNVGS